MSWREACALTRVLSRDPSSWLCAAAQGWEYPLTREGLALADLYDLQHRTKAKNPRSVKPYPRPFSDKEKKRYGRATRPQHVIRAELAKRGLKAVRPPTSDRPRDARGRFIKKTGQPSLSGIAI